MAATRITFNIREFERLRKSPGVVADIKERVDRIAAASNAHVEGNGYEATVQEGRNRAHGSVITTDAESMSDNARNQRLLRNLDAGRG